MSAKEIGIDEILSADTGPALPVDGVNLKKDYAPYQKFWAERNAHGFGDKDNDNPNPLSGNGNPVRGN